jgi:hypothetical protein
VILGQHCSDQFGTSIELSYQAQVEEFCTLAKQQWQLALACLDGRPDGPCFFQPPFYAFMINNAANQTKPAAVWCKWRHSISLVITRSLCRSSHPRWQPHHKSRHQRIQGHVNPVLLHDESGIYHQPQFHPGRKAQHIMAGDLVLVNTNTPPWPARQQRKF